MTEPTRENVDTHVGQPDEIVRRFDSRKNVRQAQKTGIQFNKDRGIGIPATTTNIEPVDPDRIKDVTGARNTDAWMDIDVSGKKVLRRQTKEGRKEIVIQEDVAREDIHDAGRTYRSRHSKEALDDNDE